MGQIRNPNWSTSGMRVTLSYLPRHKFVTGATLLQLMIPKINNGQSDQPPFL